MRHRHMHEFKTYHFSIFDRFVWPKKGKEKKRKKKKTLRLNQNLNFLSNVR